MILAGFSKGIGSCWIGFGQEIFIREDFKKEYNIPESYVSIAPLILGYMESKPKPPKRKEALIFSKR